jgi:hypothetical protein
MHRPGVSARVVARSTHLDRGEHPVLGVQLLSRTRQQDVSRLLDRQRLVRLDEGARDALIGGEGIPR